MPTSTRLRDLVRDIRSARTAAEERSVVNRECAQIRDNFREEDGIYRCRNVAKLLYIHMLGYSAHFGQLDCLKLIASNKFTDKRIGYLGAMLLLDERTDIHVLVTNSLKNDLNHTNQYIVSLALCTLGSICSTEMSRDLVTEVEKLIKSSNAYLRKKAILCAFRMIRKVPDLIELFIPATRSLLNEKNHGVLITAATLITEMCQRSPDTLSFFRRSDEMVPNLVRILKNLIMSGYSPEHDVNGVSDPFLQVKVLKLLRIVGKGDHEASDAMNDILAQVATNTDTSKNVGHAILYEIVLTIMGVESEAGLRVLAVNILGRFLLNNDKNIRYVALNTLQQVVHVDYKAVQRHRSTIVDCLLDPDVSIQRRAMELCFVLINTSNIRGMTKELLSFLHRCEPEFKSDTCSSLVLAAEKYAPNKTWHFETMLQLLTTAGNYARDDVLSSLVALISQASAMHSYAVLRLYSALLYDMSQQPLIQIASWCIGEYGEYLITSQNITPPDDEVSNEPVINNSENSGCVLSISIPNCKTPVSENALLSVLEKALLSSSVTQYTKQIIQLSLVKLSTRLKLESSIKLIRQLICVHSTSINLELQQRSVEFSSIFRNYDNLRIGLLEAMPVMETRVLSGTLTGNREMPIADSSNNLSGQLNGYGSEIITDVVVDGKLNTAGQLLDLLSMTDPVVSNNVQPSDLNLNGTLNPNSSAGGNIFDLLGDLSLNSNTAPISNHTDPVASNVMPQINDIKPTISSIIVYESNHGLKLTFSFEKISSSQSTVTLHAINNGNQLIDQFLFQAAVPKSFQLALLAPSSESLVPFGGSLTQLLKLSNPNKQPWKMKIRLQYRLNGEVKLVQHQLDTFPSDLWT